MHKHVISRHTWRRKARKRESEVERVLALANGRVPGQSRPEMLNARDRLLATRLDDRHGLPRTWRVRVDKADADEPGRWLVVGTPPGGLA
jgi:hypothetical protein